MENTVFLSSIAKMKTIKISGLACLLAFLPGLASAQVEPGTLAHWWQQAQQTWREGVTSHQIDIENDSLLLKRDDGMFTSGNRYRLQSWQSDARRAMVSEWRIGHDIYTPLDIKLPAALVRAPDHPYAAWLYTGFSHSEWQMNGSQIGFGLDLGCLGPCAGGEAVQTRLHRILRQPLPQGWAKQVKNEWGAIFSLDWAGARSQLGSSADWQPRAQLRLGNINTDATLGAVLRFGQRNSLPQNAAQFGYLSLDARAVGYDATLQGGYFAKDNQHTVAPKRLYAQAEVGMQWVGQEYAARVGVVRRGNTIRDLPNSAGAQNYMSLQLVYTPSK